MAFTASSVEPGPCVFSTGADPKYYTHTNTHTHTFELSGSKAVLEPLPQKEMLVNTGK